MSAVPARMMQQRAYKVGAVIPGWRDIRQLGRINVVQATSRQLFPEGCVTLRDIHPVKIPTREGRKNGFEIRGIKQG